MTDSDPDPDLQPSIPATNGRHDVDDEASALVGPVDDSRSAPTRAGSASPVPFQDLVIPAPSRPAPPLGARVGAFAGILVGGLLGGLIGYGTADLMSGGAAGWVVIGLVVGALAGAIGVGIVAGLTLRAMNEWTATVHPEDARSTGGRRRSTNRPAVAADDDFKLRPHLGGSPRSASDRDPGRD